MIKLSIALIFCLACFADSCASRPGGNQPAASSNTQPTAADSAANPAINSEAAAVASPNICGLIENAEVASVQGAPVQSVVPGNQTSGTLAISQCYYAVTSADGSKNLSVHLQVISGDAKTSGRDGVKEFWEERFKGEKKRDADADEEEEEEGGGKPQPVAGVGHEAFWMGDIRAGALYVIQRDKIVRISVGGPDEAKIKLEKSKTLARQALMRLK